MKPTQIIVYVTKPMLVVHHHPHLMDVLDEDRADKLQHLGAPHDHYVDITVRMECKHLERDKDLLLLHLAVEKATKWPARVSMGQASFEQMCVIIGEDVVRRAEELGGIEPVLYSVCMASMFEGAEVIWGKQ